MIRVFSDLQDKLNSKINDKIVPGPSDFFKTRDSSQFIYTVYLKMFMVYRNAPVITLQAHTRPKTSMPPNKPFELIDGENVLTCTIEVRARGMDLKRKGGSLNGIGYDLPIEYKTDRMQDIHRGRDEIFLVIKHFYVVAGILYTFGYWSHTITQLDEVIGSEIYRLQVHSRESTYFSKPSTREFFIAANGLKQGNMVIHESNPTKETHISDYDALVEYLNSIYTQPRINARYESENRRLDILIDSMRNN